MLARALEGHKASTSLVYKRVRKSLRLKVTVAKACLLYRLLIIVVLVRIMNLHQRIILIG